MIDLVYKQGRWRLTHGPVTVLESPNIKSVIERGRMLVQHGCDPGPGLADAIHRQGIGAPINPSSYLPTAVKAMRLPYLRSIL